MSSAQKHPAVASLERCIESTQRMQDAADISVLHVRRQCGDQNGEAMRRIVDEAINTALTPIGEHMERAVRALEGAIADLAARWPQSEKRRRAEENHIKDLQAQQMRQVQVLEDIHRALTTGQLRFAAPPAPVKTDNSGRAPAETLDPQLDH